MMAILLLGLGFVAFEVFHKAPASPKQFPRAFSPKRFIVHFSHTDPTTGNNEDLTALETDDPVAANRSFDETFAQLRTSGLKGEVVFLFDQNVAKSIRMELV